MDEAGYIKTIPGTSKTNVEGVFAQVMYRIKYTGRLLPQQVAAVWLLWMQKDTSVQKVFINNLIA